MNESTYKRFVMKKYKGLVLPLTGTGYRGIPDYLVLQEGGRVVFVEVKCGSKLSRLQQVRIQQLQEMGFEVHIIEYKRKRKTKNNLL